MGCGVTALWGVVNTDHSSTWTHYILLKINEREMDKTNISDKSEKQDRGLTDVENKPNSRREWGSKNEHLCMDWNSFYYSEKWLLYFNICVSSDDFFGFWYSHFSKHIMKKIWARPKSQWQSRKKQKRKTAETNEWAFRV